MKHITSTMQTTVIPTPDTPLQQVELSNAGDLLPECLEPIRHQLEERDTLVVVDDASGDDTAATAARLGARVIRRGVAGGPYAARNDGWRASEQPYILFTDVRCVVRHGWLASFRQAAADGGDLIFSDVLVRSGARLAERVAAQRQHLLSRHYLATPYFLPHAPRPTSPCGARRSSTSRAFG